MGTLVVVRHGQASLFAADYDEMSPQGIVQAEQLGRFLGAHGPHATAVFCGPAVRHRETARHCGVAYSATGRAWPAPVLVPAFDEHDAFGLIASVTSDPHHQRDPQLRRAMEAAEQASAPAERSASFQRLFEAIMQRWLRGEVSDDLVESWPQFQTRVENGLTDLLTGAPRGGPLLLVTSVGPLAVLLRRALGTSDADSFRTAWRIRNASMTTFVFRDDAFTLDAFNALPHLPDPATWTFR